MRGRGGRERQKKMGAWGEESEQTSDLCVPGGEGKKKARTHQGAEIKKREQAGGKNSRFGICVSEAVQRWRRRRRQQRRCTNVTHALHAARKKKSAKDTEKKVERFF